MVYSLCMDNAHYIHLNRAEISSSAILHNVAFYESLSTGTGIIPVLKSNAYGHGIAPVAQILGRHSFPYVAVNSFQEALQVREVSDQPVLVMGAVHPANFAGIRFPGYAFAVHQPSTIAALGETGRAVRVHLELETGMNRHGVKKHELDALLSHIKAYPALELEGVMTHLADTSDIGFSTSQISLFDECVELIRAAGFAPALFHSSQSTGSLSLRSRHPLTPRVGIGIFGVNPLDVGSPLRARLNELQPAMTVVSTVTTVQNADAGESVSYGRTFKTGRPSRIGILPFGYYEGLPRAMSNVGTVTHGTTQLPIVGRVCMNHCMVDLTGSDLREGDEVTIISPRRDDPNSIESIALKNGMYSYTLLTGIDQNVDRIIV
jgi:alanine racemase